jgi:hypothetical protein
VALIFKHTPKHFYSMITFSTRAKTINDPEESANIRGIDSSEDYKVVYTNDCDGAYHVEQDDETESDALINKTP